ncbi:MAG: deoxyribonuclease IV [Pirellulales bacterium]
MPILGAHESIAGGYDRAVEKAGALGCDCVQLFTKNNNQWRAKAITDADVAAFQAALAATRIVHPLVHASYLINLASPDKRLWQKSVEAFAGELRRAERLGIPYVVTHPGAYTSGTEQSGLGLVIHALDEVHRLTRGIRTGCLLETTAGQGTSLGWRFEQLAKLLDGVADPDRLGVCIDTCHVFAAGYLLSDRKGYSATMKAFGRLIGLEKIKAVHLNDSQRGLGSRVDRHARIGGGCLGLDAFRRILNDPRFQETPMYLETPKGAENGIELDVINLEILRGLVER